jgi:hypothetical protein
VSSQTKKKALKVWPKVKYTLGLRYLLSDFVFVFLSGNLHGTESEMTSPTAARAVGSWHGLRDLGLCPPLLPHILDPFVFGCRCGV